MKYLKKYENYPGDNYTVTVSNRGLDLDSDGSVIEPIKIENHGDLIYDKNWEKDLPEKITINYKNKLYSFTKGNIMLLSDLVQITYEATPDTPQGPPDTLEFDIYFVKDNDTNKIRMDIDITYGELMACEFSVEPPNKVNIIQHTTYHSKYDPSNTVFALETNSLNKFINFLNRFSGMKLSNYDLRFLDNKDNYHE